MPHPDMGFRFGIVRAPTFSQQDAESVTHGHITTTGNPRARSGPPPDPGEKKNRVKTSEFSTKENGLILSLRASQDKDACFAPTIGSALGHLVSLGIVREITGKQRRRVFAYHAYLDILSEGTEPR